MLKNGELDYEGILRIYHLNELGWNLLLGAVVLIIAYIISRETKWEWWNTIPRRRGKMRRRDRRNWVRRDAIDAFVSHVEERVFAEIYTRKEASELYRDARKYWPVKELFPSPELLRANIEWRLKNQTHTPVNLPDKKEKARPKHMFEKPIKA